MGDDKGWAHSEGSGCIKVQGGAPIVAAPQTGNQIDIFFADGNGAVNVMWVVDVGTWQGPIVI